MTRPQERGIPVRIDLETLVMFADESWQRKVDRVEELPIPEQEWDEYHEAVDLRDRLLGLDCVYDACGLEIEEPTPRHIHHYAETREEWLERIQARVDDGEVPGNEAIRADPGIVDYFFGPSTLMDAMNAQSPTELAHQKVYNFARPMGVTTEDHALGAAGFAPSVSKVAEHVRSQVELDVFKKKECE